MDQNQSNGIAQSQLSGYEYIVAQRPDNIQQVLSWFYHTCIQAAANKCRALPSSGTLQSWNKVG